MKRLRRFEKILLKAGETRKVTFTQTKDDLAFIGMDNKAVTEDGEFKIQIGSQTKKFNYKN